MGNEEAGKGICCLLALGIIGMIFLQILFPDGTFLILAIPPFIILAILGVSLYLAAAGFDERGQKISKYGFLMLCIIITSFIAFPLIASKSWTNTNHPDITTIAISDDGSKVCVAAPGGEYGGSGLYFYDGYSGTMLWELSLSATYMKISSNGKYMIAGVDDIYLLDVNDGSTISHLDFNKAVTEALISSDGNYYTALCENGTLFLFKKAVSNPIWKYSSSSIISVDITDDGSRIIAGSNNNYIYLFNISSSTPIWSYLTPNDVNSVSISSDGLYFLAGCENSEIFFFQKDKGTYEWKYNLEHTVNFVKLSGDAQHAVAITEYEVDSSTHRDLYSISPLISDNYKKLEIPFDLDFDMFAFSDDTTLLIECRMTSGSSTRPVAGGREVYGTNAGQIELYRISGAEITSISVFDKPHIPLGAVISGNGKFIAYCGDTNKAYENHGIHYIDLDYSTYHNIALMGIYISLGAIPAAMILIGKTNSSKKPGKTRTTKKFDGFTPQEQKMEVRVIQGKQYCPNCGNPIPAGNRVCWKCFTEIR